MAVNEVLISGKIREFITQQQGTPKEDADQAIKEFSDELAGIIKEAILSMTITIQPGQIQVTGSAAAQTNAAPVILQGTTNLS